MARFDVLTTDDRTAWMRALDAAAPYDFYHLPQYHALEASRGEGEPRLFYFTEGPYSIALPLLLRPLDKLPFASAEHQQWFDATSVYGYAGPVCSHTEMPVAITQAFHAALAETLCGLRVVAVFSRLHPLLDQTSVLDGLGECAPISRTVSIDLTLPADEQRAQFSASNRRKMNRLRRLGVTCVLDREGRYFDDFLEIYDETMRRVQAAPMYFFGREYFDRLRTELASNLELFVCLQEGRATCAGLFCVCQGIVQYHLAGTRTEDLPLSPVRLLIDEARLWAFTQGHKVLHLGGGATSRPDDPIFYSKIGFSDRTHPFSVWRWVLQPDIYQQLCVEKSLHDHRHGQQAATGYFPQYRSPPLVFEPAPASAAEAEVCA